MKDQPMNFNEFMESEGKTIIDDFLIDNKNFDSICKESYNEYLEGLDEPNYCDNPSCLVKNCEVNH